jgi:hypothetical protein
MALIQSTQIQYPLSGSFSGSFYGDGSGLTNISASSIIGLNLFQISSGSVSASVSPIGNIFLVKSASVDYLSITSRTTTIQNDVFLIKDNTNKTTFTISQSIAYFPTQSSVLTGSTVAGGIYFTSSSFYVGLEN